MCISELKSQWKCWVKADNNTKKHLPSESPSILNKHRVRVSFVVQFEKEKDETIFD